MVIRSLIKLNTCQNPDRSIPAQSGKMRMCAAVNQKSEERKTTYQKSEKSRRDLEGMPPADRL